MLEKAAGDSKHVLAKVRLADIVAPKTPRSNAQEWRRAFNMIQSKHLDFLVCEAGTLKVLCAVELDDKSHRRAGRMDRDAFKDRTLSDAGIPLHRFAVQRQYNEREGASKISETGKSDAGGGLKVEPSFKLT